MGLPVGQMSPIYRRSSGLIGDHDVRLGK